MSQRTQVKTPVVSSTKENFSGKSYCQWSACRLFLYRKQWVNIEGAPTTGTFFINSPVGKNVGLGLSAVSDKIGPVDETNVYADFSYTLNLGGDRRLAFGLKRNIMKTGNFHDAIRK